MTTLTEAAAACCACIRVRWLETRHETGEVSGRWVCSSCQREFVPGTTLDAEQARAFRSVVAELECEPTREDAVKCIQALETERAQAIERATRAEGRAEHFETWLKNREERIRELESKSLRYQMNAEAEVKALREGLMPLAVRIRNPGCASCAATAADIAALLTPAQPREASAAPFGACAKCGTPLHESSRDCWSCSAPKTRAVSEATLAKVREALEGTLNGLLWYRNEFPKVESEADHEMEAEAREAIALLDAEAKS